MSPEEMKTGRFANMTTKQKVTSVALVIVVLVIIWQIMSLFGGEKTTAEITPAAAPVAGMSANAPGTATPVAQSAPTAPAAPAQGAAPNPMAQPHQTYEEPQLKQAPVAADTQILDLQKKTEENYIGQLNQLQNLKIQREIAETNQAIASARLATVTAEKSVSDLLTRPTEPPPPPPVPVPQGAYANALVNPAPTGEAVPPLSDQVPPPPVVMPPAVDYSVISVSMQLGRWSALVGYQGKLYSVSVGDVLPVDGSIVTSISKNGIMLKTKTGKRKRVSILTAI